jgi:hypothetical protein
MSIDLRTEASSPTARFASLDAVLALIVGVGAVLYPIGFIQLVARVCFGATNDFSTAWLVASLMPPVQVAGQGVRALAGMWWFLIFLSVLLLYLYRWPLDETRSLREYLSAALSTWPVVIIVVVGTAASVITSVVSERSWQAVVGSVIRMVMGLLIAALIVTHRARRAFIQLALVTAVVYIGTSASLVLDASQHHDPGLPHVEVGSYKGWLVAHSDGYWYVLTTSGGLDAIPDQQASSVVITP